MVGVNRFKQEDEKPVPLQQIDESLERKQVERLQALRARRDARPWTESLKKIEEAARVGRESDAADCGGG